MSPTKKKQTKHYVDNQKFLADIIDYRRRVEEAAKEGKEKPRITEYCGKCIWLITENLAKKPNFMNYPFIEEMKSDAIENCIQYFDRFDPDKGVNPFAYFTQFVYYAFLRRIAKEEKSRYIIYKRFQESIVHVDEGGISLSKDDDREYFSYPVLLQDDGTRYMQRSDYENINEFIKSYEKKEKTKKDKRKQAKEGIEKFVDNEEEELDNE